MSASQIDHSASVALWFMASGRATPIVLPTHQEIACRAYEIFVRCGREPSRPDQDWLEAQRELIREAISAVGAPESDTPSEEQWEVETLHSPAAFRPARLNFRSGRR